MKLFEEIDRVTLVYRAGMGLEPRPIYVKAPCESLVRIGYLEQHQETCPACRGGWSIWEIPESEERYLDDPRHVPYSHQRPK